MKTIAYHKAGLSDYDKTSLENAATLTMMNGIGMCLLSFKTSKIVPVAFGFQIAGLVLFPGLVCYRIYTKDTSYTRYVPYGGSSMILSWIIMGLL